MINLIKQKIIKILNLDKITDNQNEIKKLLGETALKEEKEANNINDYELKIFSQFGEDGIIDYLIKSLKIEEKNFIEFGVENYEEANTRFLLESRNWSGLIFDSSKEHINFIKGKNYYWRQNLIAKCEFITSENINSLIQEHNGDREVGLLSIDVDGNDYWIWKAINGIIPKIVVIEYNARLGKKKSIVTPYKKDFNRIKEHHSSIYFGASLIAIYKLAKEKNYSLVGTNINGSNAFCVHNDVLKNSNIKSLSPEQCFHKNSFNELRDEKGNILDRDEKKEKEILSKMDFVET